MKLVRKYNDIQKFDAEIVKTFIDEVISSMKRWRSARREIGKSNSSILVPELYKFPKKPCVLCLQFA